MTFFRVKVRAHFTPFLRHHLSSNHDKSVGTGERGTQQSLFISRGRQGHGAQAILRAAAHQMRVKWTILPKLASTGHQGPEAPCVRLHLLQFLLEFHNTWGYTEGMKDFPLETCLTQYLLNVFNHKHLLASCLLQNSLGHSTAFGSRVK